MRVASCWFSARTMVARTVLLTAILAFAGSSARAAPLTTDSLGRLRHQGGTLVRPFQFVVAGETRASLPYVMPPVFSRVISQANRQRPAFVALLGDLIMGEDIAAAPRQWDEFARVAGAFSAPVLCAAGEHDVWSEASARLWSQRIGPRWYAFAYGGSHFIVLDTEADPRHWISGSQLAWLEKELESAKSSKGIYLFMHRPLFGERASNWDTVHAMLMRYPVRVVFASHEGRYEMATTRQGIRYYVTGGGGGAVTESPEMGGFAHFLLVTVQGAQAKVEVLRPSGDRVDPGLIRSNQRAAALAARRNITITSLSASLGSGLSTRGSISIMNASPLATLGSISWSVPSAGWTVVPATDSYEASPGRWARRDFRLTATPEALLGPLPTVGVGYSLAYVDQPIAITRVLPLTRWLDVAQATSAVSVDGDLSDWGNVASLPLGNLLGTRPAGPDDCSASARFAWSAGRLCVAVEVRDDIVVPLPAGAERQTNTDHVRLVVAPFDATQNRDDSPGLDCVACQTAEGPQLYRLLGQGEVSGLTPSSEIEFASIRVGGVTTYEFAVRPGALAPLLLTAGERLSINVFVADDDGPRTPEEFTVLSLIGGGLPNDPDSPRLALALK